MLNVSAPDFSRPAQKLMTYHCLVVRYILYLHRVNQQGFTKNTIKPEEIFIGYWRLARVEGHPSSPPTLRRAVSPGKNCSRYFLYKYCNPILQALNWSSNELPYYTILRTFPSEI